MPLLRRGLFLLLFFPSFFFITDISANLSDYCPERRCGNLTVKYPFYLQSTIASSSESICGYEGLGISCDKELPILSLPSDIYLVKDIIYIDTKLVLVDKEIGLGSCPTPRHNVSLDPNSTLTLDPVNSNYTFLINCSAGPSSSSNSYPSPTSRFVLRTINCLSSQYHRSYVLPPHHVSLSAPWLQFCNRSVVVPFDGVGGIPGNGMFPAVVKNGFVLDWTQEPRCSGCEATKGSCGRNRVTTDFICFCNDGPHDKDCNDRKGVRFKVIAAITAAVASILLVAFLWLFFWVSTSRRSPRGSGCLQFHAQTKINEFLIDYKTLAATRYTYKEITKMTKNFKHKLGQGGYASVYNGWLSNGTQIALKLIEKSYNDGEEFCNEVATIGRIHHVNVVRLLGFYVEGSRRALIYEFMENGSLEKFSDSTTAGGCLLREKICDIALGIARGIEYLHQGCDRRIIHFDIKPHNILLDHDFTPKISDFGLAQSYGKERNSVTIKEGKGTIGYIAPELIYGNSKHVSPKSDVYSFGMLLIVMIGMKEKFGPCDGSSSEAYFPHWIHVTLSKNLKFEGIGERQDEMIRKIATIALWCIQWNPHDRPCMKEVIRMLESSTSELTMPATEPQYMSNHAVHSSSTSECSGL